MFQKLLNEDQKLGGFTEFQFRFFLIKTYFDKGFGYTSHYLKYPLALFAMWEIVVTKNFKTTLIIGVIWMILSFILGWLVYRYGWYSAEIEVGNRINPLAQELREHMKNGKL